MITTSIESRNRQWRFVVSSNKVRSHQIKLLSTSSEQTKSVAASWHTQGTPFCGVLWMLEIFRCLKSGCSDLQTKKKNISRAVTRKDTLAQEICALQVARGWEGVQRSIVWAGPVLLLLPGYLLLVTLREEPLDLPLVWYDAAAILFPLSFLQMLTVAFTSLNGLISVVKANCPVTFEEIQPGERNPPISGL